MVPVRKYFSVLISSCSPIQPDSLTFFEQSYDTRSHSGPGNFVAKISLL